MQKLQSWRAGRMLLDLRQLPPVVVGTADLPPTRLRDGALDGFQHDPLELEVSQFPVDPFALDRVKRPELDRKSVV